MIEKRCDGSLPALLMVVSNKERPALYACPLPSVTTRGTTFQGQLFSVFSECGYCNWRGVWLLTVTTERPRSRLLGVLAEPFLSVGLNVPLLMLRSDWFESSV